MASRGEGLIRAFRAVLTVTIDGRDGSGASGGSFITGGCNAARDGSFPMCRSWPTGGNSRSPCCAAAGPLACSTTYSADSGHRDQPIRLIVITQTGDRDHAAHLGRGVPGVQHGVALVVTTDVCSVSFLPGVRQAA
jgi:hypothetical protein